MANLVVRALSGIRPLPFFPFPSPYSPPHPHLGTYHTDRPSPSPRTKQPLPGKTPMPSLLLPHYRSKTPIRKTHLPIQQITQNVKRCKLDKQWRNKHITVSFYRLTPFKHHCTEKWIGIYPIAIPFIHVLFPSPARRQEGNSLVAQHFPSRRQARVAGRARPFISRQQNSHTSTTLLCSKTLLVSDTNRSNPKKEEQDDRLSRAAVCSLLPSVLDHLVRAAP